MRSLFGFSQDWLVLGVGSAVGLVVLALLVFVLRQPLFARLAVRRAFRRPGLAALITAGLTVSTVVLSSAFTTGDTVSLSVRSVVAGVVGSADEIVFLPKRGRRSGAELAQALASGTFLSGWNDYFSEGEYPRVREILGDDPRVAAVVPAVLEHVSAGTAELGLRGQLALLGLPPEMVRAAGGLRTDSGLSVDLGALAPAETALNAEAALVLGVGVGDAVELYGLAEPATLRVAAVTRTGDVGGAQAALFMPLEVVQRLVGRPGEINQILVSNRGSAAERLQSSWPLTVTLRSGLMDDAAAERLFGSLSAGPVRDALTRESLRGPGVARAQEKLNRLKAIIDGGQVTPEFEALVQDPELTGRLASSLNVSPGALEQSPLFGAAGGGRRLRALDVQQMAQDQADRWASAFTSLFVAFGLFSLSTGVLLVILVFSLLALERRGELGTMRALGGRRRDVVAMLACEGVVHSALAAGVGLVLGVVLASGLLAVAGNLLAQYGFRIEPSIEPASLLVSAGLGFLLTTLTVTYGSWRASRFSIVAAIRDVPDPPGASRSWLGLLWAAILLAGGTAGGGLGLGRGWVLAYVVGQVCTVLGLALLICWLLRRFWSDRAERWVWTGAGALLVMLGLGGTERLRAVGIPAPLASVELSVLGGLVALLGGVWIVAVNAGVARLFARRLVALRLSAAELAAHRFRTGMTLAMFSLVVLSLTVAAVLLTVTHVAFGDPEVTSGGWHVRGERAGPPLDLGEALASGPIRGDTFAGSGVTASLSVQAIQTERSDARWEQVSLTSVDQSFTASVQALARGEGADGRALWQQLSQQPGTAIIGAGLLASNGNELRVDLDEHAAFRTFSLWIRDTRETRPAVRLQVIGLADARGPYGRGVVVGEETIRSWPAPDRYAYVFSLPHPEEAREAALALNLAVPELSAQAIGDDLRLMQGVRGLLTMVLQGYMGIGLVSGLAALAVISTRAVVERRRQIGTLRALGASGRSVTLMLLLESAVVAAGGAVLGVAIGLSVAHHLVLLLTRQTPELRFSIPWDQLLFLVLLVLITGLLTTILPARQAGRLAPAEALREG